MLWRTDICQRTAEVVVHGEILKAMNLLYGVSQGYTRPGEDFLHPEVDGSVCISSNLWYMYLPLLQNQFNHLDRETGKQN